MASPDMFPQPNTRDGFPALVAMVVAAFFVGSAIGRAYPGNSQTSAIILFSVAAYFPLMWLLMLGMWLVKRHERRKRSLGAFSVPCCSTRDDARREGRRSLFSR